MDGYDVKKTMNQVHISPEMQEAVIMNIQKRMENGYKNTRTWNGKRLAATAAALVLMAGVASFPVRALMTDALSERMESIPKEELQAINDMVQSQHREAEILSRGYSNSERERYNAFWKAYKGGKFPENVIAQVDNAEDAPEGTLCYIRSTGAFNLPDREMTDEEILEIIDFKQKINYALSQSPAAQEARAEMQAERSRLRERIQAAGGISEAEAIRIATERMEDELGERAEGMEILKYTDGSVAVFIDDISEQTEYEHKGDLAYYIIFRNPEENNYSAYYCIIDTVDGSILETYE